MDALVSSEDFFVMAVLPVEQFDFAVDGIPMFEFLEILFSFVFWNPGFVIKFGEIFEERFGGFDGLFQRFLSCLWGTGISFNEVLLFGAFSAGTIFLEVIRMRAFLFLAKADLFGFPVVS